MDVKGVYLGYNSNMNFHLLMVKVYGNALHKLNGNLNIKTRTLRSLYDVSNDLTSKQRPFSINSIIKSSNDSTASSLDLTNSNNYTYKLITRLFKLIDSKPQIPLLRKSKNLIDSKANKCLYRYVIYVGYKTDENGNDIKSTKMMTILPFKSNFIFHRRSILGFIDINRHIGNNVPSFQMISNDKVFQLPINKSDDVANLYKTHDTFKLNVYKPLKFDDIFQTSDLKRNYADTILKKFTASKVKLTLNKCQVKFVKSENDLINNVDGIRNKIFNDKRLLNSMSTFTGNKNSAIQKISSKKLKKILDNLRSYPINGQRCNFEAKNVPKVSDDYKKIYVTCDNLPIFCSLLKNKVVKRVLTDDAYVPYYNEVKE